MKPFVVAESVFGERIVDADGKSGHLKECEKKIEVLSEEIDRLKSTISGFGDENSRAIGKISALEDEVYIHFITIILHLLDYCSFIAVLPLVNRFCNVCRYDFYGKPLGKLILKFILWSTRL